MAVGKGVREQCMESYRVPRRADQISNVGICVLSDADKCGQECHRYPFSLENFRGRDQWFPAKSFEHAMKQACREVPELDDAKGLPGG